MQDLTYKGHEFFLNILTTYTYTYKAFHFHMGQFTP